MLITPEQYAAITAPVPEVSRRQAHPYPLGSRFNSWDWGVIPYEVAPNFTEAERTQPADRDARMGNGRPGHFRPENHANRIPCDHEGRC